MQGREEDWICESGERQAISLRNNEVVRQSWKWRCSKSNMKCGQFLDHAYDDSKLPIGSISILITMITFQTPSPCLSSTHHRTLVWRHIQEQIWLAVPAAVRYQPTRREKKIPKWSITRQTQIEFLPPRPLIPSRSFPTHFHHSSRLPSTNRQIIANA